MSFVYPLLFFLGLYLACVYASDDQFLYSGFAGANLTLDGMATVTPDGLLELTNGMEYLKGHAFYPTPLRFRESHNGTVRSFSVSFVFAMLSVYPEEQILGQGQAFVVAPSKDFSGAMANQYLGLLNGQNNGNASNRIFAVELDTLMNFDFQDINGNHVGIDINSLHSLQSHTAGYFDDKNGSFQNLTLISDAAMQVWVDYEREATQIKVTMAPLKLAKPMRPLVTATYNLSTVITDQAYVGFSSATPTSNLRNYVLGWSFSMDEAAPAIDITKLPKLPRLGSQPRSRVMEIILPIATTMLVLAAVVAVFLLRQRRMRYAELREDWEVEFGPHRFSYKDLYRATEGFKNKHLLGIGGFGRVYRGVLPTFKLEVAVKRVSHESRQGMREFIAEVVSMGRLRHRNIVQLLGYCRRKGELLLVYDYMPNSSLDKYLYNHGDRPTLDWSHRFRIIKGVASGLLYIHEDWEQVVVHRDVKASNVLLDGEMNGRLGDFGLARLYDHGTDPQTTHIVGTIGYLAPELTRTGKASPLTDVFAFGVFLLEVTCGQRPIEQMAQDSQVLLVDWVLEHWHNGSLTKVVDVRLQDKYDTDEACLVLKLGLLCSHPLPSSRPSMRQVMQYLDGDLPLPELTPTDAIEDEGFDAYLVSLPLSTASMSTTCSLSRGR